LHYNFIFHNVKILVGGECKTVGKTALIKI
jgi:hypothetical protein